MSFKKLRQMYTIKGSEEVNTNEVQVSSFLNLVLAVNGQKEQPVEIELHQAEEEKVIFETNQNLLSYYTAVNSGRTLFIAADAGYKSLEFTSLKVKVFIKQLTKLNVCSEYYQLSCNEEIAMNRDSSIKVQGTGKCNLNINTSSVKILLQNKGDVEILGHGNMVEIRNQSDGQLNAKSFVAKNIKIKNQSTGNVELFAEETLNIAHYGKGNIIHSGNAKLSDVRQYGEGLIKYQKTKENEVN